jgi:hypothetical protein
MINIQTVNSSRPVQSSIRISQDKIVNIPEEVVIQKTMSNVDTQIRKVQNGGN